MNVKVQLPTTGTKPPRPQRVSVTGNVHPSARNLSWTAAAVRYVQERPAIILVFLLVGYMIYRRMKGHRRSRSTYSVPSVLKPKKEEFDSQTLMALDMRRHKAVQELQAQYDQQARLRKEQEEQARLQKQEQLKAEASTPSATVSPEQAPAAEVATPIKGPAAQLQRNLRRGGCS